MDRKNSFWCAVAVFGTFVALGVLGWYGVRAMLPDRAEYRLSADHIYVPPPPPWVPEDFVASVLRNSGLTSASLLESGLAEKLAKAFSADSWVETVVRVELRFPSGANVALVYRRPVAVVEVAQGLLPIDSNGVLLRTDYFINIAPEKKHDYLRVSGIRSTPLGGVGTPWGDPLVHASAQFAAILDDATEALGLEIILPSVEKTPTGNQTVFRLRTKGGAEILWGRFDVDDPNNEVRKKWLLELVEHYGSLEAVPASLLTVDGDTK